MIRVCVSVEKLTHTNVDSIQHSNLSNSTWSVGLLLFTVGFGSFCDAFGSMCPRRTQTADC